MSKVIWNCQSLVWIASILPDDEDDGGGEDDHDDGAPRGRHRSRGPPPLGRQETLLRAVSCDTFKDWPEHQLCHDLGEAAPDQHEWYTAYSTMLPSRITPPWPPPRGYGALWWLHTAWFEYLKVVLLTGCKITGLSHHLIRFWYDFARSKIELLFMQKHGSRLITS